jgi:hypothetical protein
MDKCKYDWPAAGERSLIGKRINALMDPPKPAAAPNTLTTSTGPGS